MTSDFNSKELSKLALKYSNKTISIKTATQLFGTESQKNHFEKYKGFTSKGMKVALEKTLAQLFESVEIVKDGKKKKYQLGYAREEVSAREDNRIFNRHTELPHTKYFDVIAVLKILENPQGLTKSLSKWLEEFDLVNKNILDYKNSKLNMDDFISQFELDIKSPKGNTSVLQPEFNFFVKDMQYTQTQFEAVLNHLHKDKIIKLTVLNRAQLKKEVEHYGENNLLISSDVFTLDDKSYQLIISKQQELLNKFDITMSDVFHSKFYRFKQDKRERVEAYQNAMQRFFDNGIVSKDRFGAEREIFINYIWVGYKIDFEWDMDNQVNYIKRRRPELLEEYLEKGYEVLDEWIDKYNELKQSYVLEKAQKSVKKIEQNVESKEKPLYFEKNILDNFMHNIEILYPYCTMEKDEKDDDEDDFLDSEHDPSYMSEFDEIPF